jgi:hypothetical protein
MVEMGGLEPPAPYMRSREIDRRGPRSIRFFGALSRFLPIVLPRGTASKTVSMEIFARSQSTLLQRLRL